MPISTATTNKLILVAAELSVNELGQRFIAALSAYTDELREDCIQAPLDRLTHAQGAARQATTLVNLIKTSKTEADKIVAAEQARKQKG